MALSIRHLLVFVFILAVNYESIGMTTEQAKTIKVVYVAFSNHLDVGFTNMSQDVVNAYFTKHYPKAIQTARELQARGEKFVYTTKSWLASLFLFQCPKHLFHCPNATEVTEFLKFVKSGHISWHAYPFNGQPELMNPEMFSFGIQLTHHLDELVNVPKKTVFGQRDVPGFTRAAIPILKRYGISGITVGVNGASSPPAVPMAFRWKDEQSQQDIYTLYHPGGYGGLDVTSLPYIEGFDRTIAFSYKGDNDGPHSVQEALGTFDKLRRAFPNAQIIGASFDEYFQDLQRANPQNLPVITQEIGDTWIYGAPSDPLRLAQFRAAMRARSDCLQAGQCSIDDPRFFLFSRMLLKNAEHTWGLDVKMNLDFQNWKKVDFLRARGLPNYQRMERSWMEQRQYLDHALVELKDHPLRGKILSEFSRLHPVKIPDLNGFEMVSVNQRFHSGEFAVEFSGSGGIQYLSYQGQSYAGPGYQLAEFLYATYNELDYELMVRDYSYCPDCYWFAPDFLKPNLSIHGNPLKTFSKPVLDQVWRKSTSNEDIFVLRSLMPVNVTRIFGCPSTIWTVYSFDKVKGIRIRLIWTGKSPNRMPEAAFMTFNPYGVDKNSWRVEKLGVSIDPYDVVKNGSLHQAGVDRLLTFSGAISGVKVVLESLDASVVSPSAPITFPSPLNRFQPNDPNNVGGMHFILQNNVWGTNYVMWYPFLDEDSNSLFDWRIIFV